MAGVGAIAYTAYMVRVARQSESWPMADGTILYASVARSPSTNIRLI